jgi:hypothetical protein
MVHQYSAGAFDVNQTDTRLRIRGFPQLPAMTIWSSKEIQYRRNPWLPRGFHNCVTLPTAFPSMLASHRFREAAQADRDCGLLSGQLVGERQAAACPSLTQGVVFSQRLSQGQSQLRGHGKLL